MSFIRPGLRAWLGRWAEPLIYAGVVVVLAVILYRANAFSGWAGWAGIAVVSAVAYWMGRIAVIEQRLADTQPGIGVVMIEEQRLTYLVPGETAGSGTVDLDALEAVEIRTTPLGPFVEDLYWVLTPQDGATLLIPHGAVGAEAILPALERLSGLDYERVVDAMGSTDQAVFTIWQRTKQPSQ
ncbi:MAG: hypothetical protein AAFV62_05695 [Pseudomonadota bacterium]